MVPIADSNNEEREYSDKKEKDKEKDRDNEKELSFSHRKQRLEIHYCKLLDILKNFCRFIPDNKQGVLMRNLCKLLDARMISRFLLTSDARINWNGDLLLLLTINYPSCVPLSSLLNDIHGRWRQVTEQKKLKRGNSTALKNETSIDTFPKWEHGLMQIMGDLSDLTTDHLKNYKYAFASDAVLRQLHYWRSLLYYECGNYKECIESLSTNVAYFELQLMSVSKRVRDEEKKSDEMYNDKYSYILFCTNNSNDDSRSGRQGPYCDDPNCANCSKKSRKLRKSLREKRKIENHASGAGLALRLSDDMQCVQTPNTHKLKVLEWMDRIQRISNIDGILQTFVKRMQAFICNNEIDKAYGDCTTILDKIDPYNHFAMELKPKLLRLLMSKLIKQNMSKQSIPMQITSIAFPLPFQSKKAPCFRIGYSVMNFDFEVNCKPLNNGKSFANSFEKLSKASEPYALLIYGGLRKRSYKKHFRSFFGKYYKKQSLLQNGGSNDLKLGKLLEAANNSNKSGASKKNNSKKNKNKLKDRDNSILLSDIWILNVRTGFWYNIFDERQYNKQAPSPLVKVHARYFHSAHLCNKKLWVIGGVCHTDPIKLVSRKKDHTNNSEYCYYHDSQDDRLICYYDLAKQMWTVPRYRGQVPSYLLAKHSSIVCAKNKKLYIFVPIDDKYHLPPGEKNSSSSSSSEKRAKKGAAKSEQEFCVHERLCTNKYTNRYDAYCVDISQSPTHWIKLNLDISIFGTSKIRDECFFSDLKVFYHEYSKKLILLGLLNECYCSIFIINPDTNTLESKRIIEAPWTLEPFRMVKRFCGCCNDEEFEVHTPLNVINNIANGNDSSKNSQKLIGWTEMEEKKFSLEEMDDIAPHFAAHIMPSDRQEPNHCCILFYNSFMQKFSHDVNDPPSNGPCSSNMYGPHGVVSHLYLLVLEMSGAINDKNSGGSRGRRSNQHRIGFGSASTVMPGEVNGCWLYNITPPKLQARVKYLSRDINDILVMDDAEFTKKIREISDGKISVNMNGFDKYRPASFLHSSQENGGIKTENNDDNNTKDKEHKSDDCEPKDKKKNVWKNEHGIDIGGLCASTFFSQCNRVVITDRHIIALYGDLRNIKSPSFQGCMIPSSVDFTEYCRKFGNVFYTPTNVDEHINNRNVTSASAVLRIIHNSNRKRENAERLALPHLLRRVYNPQKRSSVVLQCNSNGAMSDGRRSTGDNETSTSVTNGVNQRGECRIEIDSDDNENSSSSLGYVIGSDCDESDQPFLDMLDSIVQGIHEFNGVNLGEQNMQWTFRKEKKYADMAMLHLNSSGSCTHGGESRKKRRKIDKSGKSSKNGGKKSKGKSKNSKGLKNKSSSSSSMGVMGVSMTSISGLNNVSGMTGIMGPFPAEIMAKMEEARNNHSGSNSDAKNKKETKGKSKRNGKRKAKKERNEPSKEAATSTTTKGKASKSEDTNMNLTADEQSKENGFDFESMDRVVVCDYCNVIDIDPVYYEICSECRQRKYCSTNCQYLDWTKGGHKQKCNVINILYGMRAHAKEIGHSTLKAEGSQESSDDTDDSSIGSLPSDYCAMDSNVHVQNDEAESINASVNPSISEKKKVSEKSNSQTNNASGNSKNDQKVKNDKNDKSTKSNNTNDDSEKSEDNIKQKTRTKVEIVVNEVDDSDTDESSSVPPFESPYARRCRHAAAAQKAREREMENESQSKIEDDSKNRNKNKVKSKMKGGKEVDDKLESLQQQRRKYQSELAMQQKFEQEERLQRKQDLERNAKLLKEAKLNQARAREQTAKSLDTEKSLFGHKPSPNGKSSKTTKIPQMPPQMPPMAPKTPKTPRSRQGSKGPKRSKNNKTNKKSNNHSSHTHSHTHINAININITSNGTSVRSGDDSNSPSGSLKILMDALPGMEGIPDFFKCGMDGGKNMTPTMQMHTCNHPECQRKNIQRAQKQATQQRLQEKRKEKERQKRMQAVQAAAADAYARSQIHARQQQQQQQNQHQENGAHDNINCDEFFTGENGNCNSLKSNNGNKNSSNSGNKKGGSGRATPHKKSNRKTGGKQGKNGKNKNKQKSKHANGSNNKNSKAKNKSNSNNNNNNNNNQQQQNGKKLNQNGGSEKTSNGKASKSKDDEVQMQDLNNIRKQIRRNEFLQRKLMVDDDDCDEIIHGETEIVTKNMIIFKQTRRGGRVGTRHKKHITRQTQITRVTPKQSSSSSSSSSASSTSSSSSSSRPTIHVLATGSGVGVANAVAASMSGITRNHVEVSPPPARKRAKLIKGNRHKDGRSCDCGHSHLFDDGDHSLSFVVGATQSNSQSQSQSQSPSDSENQKLRNKGSLRETYEQCRNSSGSDVNEIIATGEMIITSKNESITNITNKRVGRGDHGGNNDENMMSSGTSRNGVNGHGFHNSVNDNGYLDLSEMNKKVDGLLGELDKSNKLTKNKGKHKNKKGNKNKKPNHNNNDQQKNQNNGKEHKNNNNNGNNGNNTNNNNNNKSNGKDSQKGKKANNEGESKKQRNKNKNKNKNKSKNQNKNKEKKVKKKGRKNEPIVVSRHANEGPKLRRMKKGRRMFLEQMRNANSKNDTKDKNDDTEEQQSSDIPLVTYIDSEHDEGDDSSSGDKGKSKGKGNNNSSKKNNSNKKTEKGNSKGKEKNSGKSKSQSKSKSKSREEKEEGGDLETSSNTTGTTNQTQRKKRKKKRGKKKRGNKNKGGNGDGTGTNGTQLKTIDDNVNDGDNGHEHRYNNEGSYNGSYNDGYVHDDETMGNENYRMMGFDSPLMFGRSRSDGHGMMYHKYNNHHNGNGNDNRNVMGPNGHNNGSNTNNNGNYYRSRHHGYGNGHGFYYNNNNNNNNNGHGHSNNYNNGNNSHHPHHPHHNSNHHSYFDEYQHQYHRSHHAAPPPQQYAQHGHNGSQQTRPTRQPILNSRSYGRTQQPQRQSYFITNNVLPPVGAQTGATQRVPPVATVTTVGASVTPAAQGPTAPTRPPKRHRSLNLDVNSMNQTQCTGLIDCMCVDCLKGREMERRQSDPRYMYHQTHSPSYSHSHSQHSRSHSHSHSHSQNQGREHDDKSRDGTLDPNVPEFKPRSRSSFVPFIPPPSRAPIHPPISMVHQTPTQTQPIPQIAQIQQVQQLQQLPGAAQAQQQVQPQIQQQLGQIQPMQAMRQQTSNSFDASELSGTPATAGNGQVNVVSNNGTQQQQQNEQGYNGGYSDGRTPSPVMNSDIGANGGMIMTGGQDASKLADLVPFQSDEQSRVQGHAPAEPPRSHYHFDDSNGSASHQEQISQIWSMYSNEKGTSIDQSDELDSASKDEMFGMFWEKGDNGSDRSEFELNGLNGFDDVSGLLNSQAFERNDRERNGNGNDINSNTQTLSNTTHTSTNPDGTTVTSMTHHTGKQSQSYGFGLPNLNNNNNVNNTNGGLSAFHEKMDYTIHGNVNGNENRNIVSGSGVVVENVDDKVKDNDSFCDDFMDGPLSKLLDSEVQTPRGDIGGFDDSLILTPVFNNSDALNQVREINEVNVAGRHDNSGNGGVNNDDGPGESDEFALDYYINGGKQQQRQQRQQRGAGMNDQRNINENNFYFEDGIDTMPIGLSGFMENELDHGINSLQNIQSIEKSHLDVGY